MRPPAPPRHLSSESKNVWRFWVRAADLDPDHLTLLRNMCEANDRALQASEILAREGLVGPDGKRHYCIDVENAARAGYLRAQAQLSKAVAAMQKETRPKTWSIA